RWLVHAQLIVKRRNDPVFRLHQFACRLGVVPFINIPQAGTSQVREDQHARCYQQQSVMADTVIERGEHDFLSYPLGDAQAAPEPVARGKLANLPVSYALLQACLSLMASDMFANRGKHVGKLANS